MLATRRALRDIGLGLTPWVPWDSQYGLDSIIAGYLTDALAKDVSGAGSVNRDYPPTMGAEDFAFMLERCPGAMILIGNGDTAFCHHPEFDFADDAIPYGVSFWVRLAETALGSKR